MLGVRCCMDLKIQGPLKILLITRRVKNKIQFITQVGTGNYNEKDRQAVYGFFP